MAYVSCSYCSGSGLEYRPSNETCSTCGGNGKTYGYGDLCGTCNGTGTVSINRNLMCRVCSGSGKQYRPDSNIRKERSTTNHKSNQRTTKSQKKTASNKDSENNIQGYIGLAGLIAGGVFTYSVSDENLIAAAIVGLITAYLAYRWYKAIIILFFIALAIYLFGANN